MKGHRLLVLVLVLDTLLLKITTGSNVTMSTILNDLFTSDYDKKLPPKYDRVGADRQVIVETNMYINSMFSISEKNMDYAMSIFLRERWVDERLNFTDDINITRLTLHSSLFDDIWIPDMYILNEKHSDYHEVTVPNKLVHIYPDGTVQMSVSLKETFNVSGIEQLGTDWLKVNTVDKKMLYCERRITWNAVQFSIPAKQPGVCKTSVPNSASGYNNLFFSDGPVRRVTGTFSCLMHLQKYPFDTQYCHFEVESYGHSTESMKFVWSDTAVSVASNIEFPQFRQTDIQSYSCEKDYYGIVYPCIGVKIELKRNYEYYIIQIYVPSILIVVLSWVNFWLDVTAVPARISLGLLTVLTMTTQSAGARANLPRVSYVKAIDVYMATCLTFVFLGLIEFALINVLTRSDNSKPLEQKIRMPNITKVDPLDSEKKEERKPSKKEIIKGRLIKWWDALWSKGRASFLDRISRMIFPISFLFFNLVYWVYYFQWDPKFDEDTP